MCKHELEKLIGTADGIVCSGCGKLFKDFAEIEADRGEKPEPKKARKKKDA